MVKQLYPRLEINLQYLKENVRTVVDQCAEFGIQVAGVIKGTTGIPECAMKFVEGGVTMIASSRLEQIEDAKEYGITLPMLLLRVPMLSEVPEVIRLTDISLNSEIKVLRALNEEAAKQGKHHKVILILLIFYASKALSSRKMSKNTFFPMKKVRIKLKRST